MGAMALHHDTRILTVEQLGPDDLVETFAFLDRDPVVNVYLIALTLRDGLAQIGRASCRERVYSSV